MTDPLRAALTAAEVAALHNPELWYEAFIAVSGDEARTPEGRRAIYDRWRHALRAALAAEGLSLVKTADWVRAQRDGDAERAYVNNYIEGRDAAIREALIRHVGDMVGRQAAVDVVDAALREALGDKP